MTPFTTTESDSLYDHLEKMPVLEILELMNREDRGVPLAVAKALPSLERLIKVIVEQMSQGGRVFYIGAGTSGRLGILDASEVPPTFGVDDNQFIGLIAGGDRAIRKAVEFAEDDMSQAWLDLEAKNIHTLDTVIGIAASGNTPYVIGGLQQARLRGLKTGAVVCNLGSRIAAEAEFPVEVVVGPEFITGSTRLKSGTAQKLVLNMISSTVMIQLGKIKGNKMVDMQLTNTKLIDRGVRMIISATGADHDTAAALLHKNGNVRLAIHEYGRGQKG